MDFPMTLTVVVVTFVLGFWAGFFFRELRDEWNDPQ